MITKTKITAALTALTLAATVAMPSSDAQALGWGGALAVGLIGGAIVGAAVASQAQAAPVYVDGYRRCRFVRQYDGYGFCVGTAKVCNYYGDLELRPARTPPPASPPPRVGLNDPLGPSPVRAGRLLGRPTRLLGVWTAALKPP